MKKLQVLCLVLLSFVLVILVQAGIVADASPERIQVAAHNNADNLEMLTVEPLPAGTEAILQLDKHLMIPSLQANTIQKPVAQTHTALILSAIASSVINSGLQSQFTAGP